MVGEPQTARAQGAPAAVGEGHGIVLAVVTLSSFFVPFMSSATNVALPQIARELDLSAPVLPWVNTSFMLASALLLLPLGRLVDLKGRRRLFVRGLALFSVVTGLVAFAPSAGWLLGLRAVQGAVGALPLAASMPLLVATFPPARRGRAIGINVAGVYTGLSLGPVIGGLLTQGLGWRSIFGLTAALMLAVPILAALRLPADRAPEGRGRFDVLGSLLYGAGLCSLMLGLGRMPSTLGAALVVAGLAGFAAFGIWELRCPSPLLDVRLMGRNRVFLFSNLAALVNYCATAAVGFLLALWLQHVKGLEPRQAGLVLVVQPALMALLSGPAGRLSDRIAPRLLASAGMGLTMVGLVLLSTLGAATPMWVVLVALAVLGVAFALFSSPNTNAVMGSVEKRYLGIASATLGTMRGLGQMLSLAITGLLFALFIGRVQVGAANLGELLQALRVAFGVFAALCFAGIFASLARGGDKAAERR